MSYHDMLWKWRFTPSGDEMFCGESGEYFKKVMAKKKQSIGNDEAVRISKKIGW